MPSVADSQGARTALDHRTGLGKLDLAGDGNGGGRDRHDRGDLGGRDDGVGFASLGLATPVTPSGSLAALVGLGLVDGLGDRLDRAGLRDPLRNLLGTLALCAQDLGDHGQAVHTEQAAVLTAEPLDRESELLHDVARRQFHDALGHRLELLEGTDTAPLDVVLLTHGRHRTDSLDFREGAELPGENAAIGRFLMIFLARHVHECLSPEDDQVGGGQPGLARAEVSTEVSVGEGVA